MLICRQRHAVLKKYNSMRNWKFKSHWSDVSHPRSTKKVFLPNPDKPKYVIKPHLPRAPTFRVAESGLRVNQLDIQMLPKQIYKQVFPKTTPESCNHVIMERCQKNLLKHNMITKKEDYVPDVNFAIPPLEGANIEEHFKNIGEKQVKPYRQLIETMLQKGLPTRPTEWVMEAGWMRYVPGQKPTPVPYPLEEAFVFDVEVCMIAGKLPTLATAVSTEAWYGWVSQSLIDGTSKAITTHQYPIDSLIPMESINDGNLKLTKDMKKPKVVIGHNVSYDRARIKEQYFLEQTGTRFVDTMSLHVCVSGVTSFQRALLKSKKNTEEDEDWKNCSSLNSLDEVHKLYCGSKIPKETRDLFVEGSLEEIRNNFQLVMAYCCSDVIATYSVLEKLFPMFSERFPHPVTLAGMLELGTAYLPINSNWNRYVSSSEQTYEDLDNEGKILLMRRADQACQLLHDDKYKEDLWMWDADWEVKDMKMRKTLPAKKVDSPERAPKKKLPANSEPEEPDELEEKFAYLREISEMMSSVNTHLTGYPGWYRKLCTKPGSTPDWAPGPHLISTSMQITPKLLNLTWEGYPLHFIRGKGWGFLIPFTDDLRANRKLPLEKLLEKCPLLTGKSKRGSGSDALTNISGLVEENLMRKEFYSRLKNDKTGGLYKGTGIWCNEEVEDCCFFLKLPHKNGGAYNVGNPLAKDFLNKFSENVLAGDTAGAEQVLSIARMLTYWRNNRARIFDQMVVWLDRNNIMERNLKRDVVDGAVYGAIVPQVVVCGTLTRRAVERTWMTASNAHPERVGSELRAMVQAPPGYNIVGADVDSQELWIASVIGDAHHAKIHGATPFGWMTLSGNKADGTDMHSVTAMAVGISRDHAKVLNYARIYGAGQNFAERLLKQFNPSLSEAEARSKASKMFTLTKGKRIYYLRKEHLLDLPDQPYSKWQAFEIAKAHRKTIDEMFLKPQWIGGTESAMFNRLEAIANNPEPRTPFLNGSLSRALEPKSMTDDRFLPTRINWVVQSGAVDFLHLMLVCMRWIMEDKARFCLSFHDEVRYLVSEQYRYQAALAMHVTNLLTRAFCASRLGIKDLPQSVAFFSAVEIDTVLRKESKDDCKTPSNPHGLNSGYGISNGESLNVNEAIEKACGQYSSWYERLRTSYERSKR